MEHCILDYATNGSWYLLDFEVCSTTQCAPVIIITDDVQVEEVESFQLSLQSNQSDRVRVDPSVVTVNIIDDDGRLLLSLTTQQHTQCPVTKIINPRHACAGRVTVVGLCVCRCLLFNIISVFSHDYLS